MAGNTIAGRLSEYAASLRFKDLPDEAVHEVKRRIIDSLGCALGAYEGPPAVILRRTAPRVAEGVSASVIGCSFPTTAEFAAFANGVMIRYLDFNDTYLSKEPAHPSDNISACLAAAEAGGRGGEDFITAVAASYEVQCALADAASLRSKGFDHVAYGAFSSTLASSMLLGLSKKETENALGISGVMSPALRQTRAGMLSMWKGAAFANAARNAVFSAMLAKSGLTGPAPIFEGEFGLFNVITGPFTLPPLAGEEGEGGAGKNFKILDTYIKRYPAEYHSQTAIEAALEISDEIEEWDEIASVTVRTFSTAYDIIGKGEEKIRPVTRETADHSLPYIVAASLMDRNITLETFSDERLRDEKLLSLVKRVKIIKDTSLDPLYPVAFPNNVEVTLKSGKTISREVLYPKGHPKNPMTDEEVEGKFRTLSSWYLTESEASLALRRLWSLEEIKDISEVMDLFREKGRGE